MSEDLLGQQFKKEFKKLCRRRSIVNLRLSTLETWVVFSHLQLALRHPENKGLSADIARKVAYRIQSKIAPNGALAKVAQRGWSQEYDVEEGEEPK